MIRTFRPWTHTSDDSYIYQLSLVVATATVSVPLTGMKYFGLQAIRLRGEKNYIIRLVISKLVVKDVFSSTMYSSYSVLGSRAWIEM